MRKYFHRSPDAKGANIYLFCFVSRRPEPDAEAKEKER